MAWRCSGSTRLTSVVVDVRRDDDDADVADVGVGPEQPAHLEATQGRHPDVEDGNIRPVLPQQDERLVAVFASMTV
jgi:hypothetical protein